MKTHEQFAEELFHLYKDEYIPLEVYQKGNVKIKMQHSCGYIWQVRPQTLLHKQGGCPRCSHKERKTIDEFKEEILNAIGNEYELRSEYYDRRTKVLMKHKKCGFEYLITPSNLIRGNRCPRCCGRYKTTEEFKEEVFEKVENEYQVLGKYKGTIIKIELKHMVCNKKYLVTPKNFLNGTRCPHCHAKSNGEKFFKKFLGKNKLQFISEYKFKDCKDKKILRFDFAIFKGDELDFLVEIDGQQHRRKTLDWNFESTQRSDAIKNKYCINHNIKLHRIDYKHTEKSIMDGIKKIPELSLYLQDTI